MEDPSWKYDVVPEIMDGKNIFDYIDKDILEKLEELEKEEEALDKARENLMEDDGEEMDPDMLVSLKEVKKKKALFKQEHKLKTSKRAYPKNKPLSEMKEKLEERGLETSKVEERVRNKRKGVKLSDLRREAEEMDLEESDDDMRDEEEEKQGNLDKALDKRKRSMSRSRSKGITVDKTEMEKVNNFQ